jgi:hypothetical protein
LAMCPSVKRVSLARSSGHVSASFPSMKEPSCGALSSMSESRSGSAIGGIPAIERSDVAAGRAR